MQLEIPQMRSGDARDSSVEIDHCNQEENGQVTWDNTGRDSSVSDTVTIMKKIGNNMYDFT
jgi:hypothetical protein